MASTLDITIPVSQINFGDSIVSDNKSLRLFHPEDYSQIKITVRDTLKPFSPTAIALDDAVRKGTFKQSLLEDFITDPLNDITFDVSFNANGGSFDSIYGKFYNYGGLVKNGSEILFVPRTVEFDLPSFIKLNTGYASSQAINMGPYLIDLSGNSINSPSYRADFSYNFDAKETAWFLNLTTAYKAVLDSGTDPTKYYNALSNLLVADKQIDNNNWNLRCFNFSLSTPQTIGSTTFSEGSSNIINATLVNGSISVDLLPQRIFVDFVNAEILPGSVSEAYNLSPVFQSTVPLITYNTALEVYLKPGFASYPVATINQMSTSSDANKASALKTLLNDPSVLTILHVENGIDIDLTGDGVIDGESFIFGVSDVKYQNKNIVITPDIPTNFFVRTGFDDFHYGSAMPDLIYGLGGNDNISTLADDDSVHGGTGNDIIDGGSGYDRAYFQGPKSQYTITTAHGLTNVVDSQKNRDDIDTLVNVEELVFTDQAEVTVAPSTTLSFRADIASNAGQSYRLYQAALDRTPDLQGLSSWINYMDNGGQLNSMSQMFIESPEFKTKYGPLDNYNFVNQLYLNVLDRSGEATGVTAWVGALDSGSWTRAQVLVGFSESAENQANVIGQIKNGVPFVAWWLT